MTKKYLNLLHFQSTKYVILRFEWDTKTKYAEKFFISGKLVEKVIADGGFYQITGLHPLPANGKHTTNFQLQKYGGKWDICFGVITAGRKQ